MSYLVNLRRTLATGGVLRLLAVGAYALIASLAGVFSMPVLDRDEARFAQATAQMLETGDGLNIRFQDSERNKKPAGAYWAQAASVLTFSTPNAREIWAFRLPSVAGAVLAALFTYAIGCALFSRQTGTMAALMLASAPGVIGEAAIAKADALLLAAVCAAMAALAQIHIMRNAGRQAPIWLAALFWTALGIGALIKGPIAPLIGISAAMLISIGRPWRDCQRALRPGLGVAILGLLIGPWLLAISAATDGRFLVESAGRDFLGKISSVQESHSGPIGYYVALAPIFLWPVAAVFPAALTAAIKRWRDPSIGFLLAWLVPGWLLFELTATKLPHYTLPLYPALCLLAAETVRKGWANPLLTKAGAVLYLVACFSIAGLIVALSSYASGSAPRLPFIVTAIAVAVAALTVALAFWRNQNSNGLIAASLVSAMTVWAMLAGLSPQLDQLAVSRRIDETLKAENMHPLRDNAPPAIVAGYFEPSIVFLLGTKTRVTDGATAARIAFASELAPAIIESREASAFETEFQALSGASSPSRLDVIGAVSGINYSNGKNVEIVIYRVRPVVSDTAAANP